MCHQINTIEPFRLLYQGYRLVYITTPTVQSVVHAFNEQFCDRGAGEGISGTNVRSRSLGERESALVVSYNGKVVCYRLSSSNHSRAVTILTHRGILEAVTWRGLWFVSTEVLQVQQPQTFFGRFRLPARSSPSPVE